MLNLPWYYGINHYLPLQKWSHVFHCCLNINVLSLEVVTILRQHSMDVIVFLCHYSILPCSHKSTCQNIRFILIRKEVLFSHWHDTSHSYRVIYSTNLSHYDHNFYVYHMKLLKQDGVNENCRNLALILSSTILFILSKQDCLKHLRCLSWKCKSEDFVFLTIHWISCIIFTISFQSSKIEVEC